MQHTPTIKNYVLPKFYTCRGNLSERWYIEFKALNTETGELQKKRIVCPAKFETKKQREIWGKENCERITKLLEKGFCFTPESPGEPERTEVLIQITIRSTLSVISATLRPKSVTTYNSALHKLEQYLQLEQLLLTTITQDQVIRFRDYLINVLQNSPRTANNTIDHLSVVYSHYQERTGLKENPFRVKKLKHEVTTKNQAFSEVDRLRIEKYLIEYEPELYLITRLIYYAFIRPGELNKLRVQDVKLTEKYIVIPGNISKNGKTETVPIIPPLLVELQKLELQDVRHNFYLCGKGLVPSRYESGKQVAFRRHEKALRACGMQDENYTLYSWKHTGAVNAYRSGVGVKELQKLLRHSSVSITDIYLKSLGLRTDPNLQNYSW
jgi:integrase